MNSCRYRPPLPRATPTGRRAGRPAPQNPKSASAVCPKRFILLSRSSFLFTATIKTQHFSDKNLSFGDWSAGPAGERDRVPNWASLGPSSYFFFAKWFCCLFCIICSVTYLFMIVCYYTVLIVKQCVWCSMFVCHVWFLIFSVCFCF